MTYYITYIKPAIRFFLVFLFLFFVLNGIFSAEKNTGDSIFIKSDTLKYTGIARELVKGMTKADFEALDTIQWLVVQPADTSWHKPKVSLLRQHTYSDLTAIIDSLAKSSMVKVLKASTTSVDGRPIYCLEIGSGTRTIVFDAGIHAREVGNPQFLLKFASELVDSYQKNDSFYVQLLQKNKLVLLPCINPDGYEAAILGKNAVRNKNLFLANQTDEKIFTAKCNANGVDLNRNFPSYSASLVWANEKIDNRRTDTVPSVNYYTGPSLGSEPETKVIMNFLMKYIPVAEKYIDFHSAGRLIYAGKPHLSDEFNEATLKTGRLIESITGYSLLGTKQEDTGRGTDGTITDFAAEIAAGYIYNENLGRIAPASSDSVIKKTSIFPYKCTVNTVETIKTSRKEGYGLLRTSSPVMHVKEWELFRLKELFLTLIVK